MILLKQLTMYYTSYLDNLGNNKLSNVLFWSK